MALGDAVQVVERGRFGAHHRSEREHASVRRKALETRGPHGRWLQAWQERALRRHAEGGVPAHTASFLFSIWGFSPGVQNAENTGVPVFQQRPAFQLPMPGVLSILQPWFNSPFGQRDVLFQSALMTRLAMFNMQQATNAVVSPAFPRHNTNSISGPNSPGSRVTSATATQRRHADEGGDRH